MAKLPKALVEPALLVWARTTASLDLGEAADAIGVSVERIQAWEDGSEKPSIPQLKKAAKAHKRPVSVLFLPEPPAGFMPLRDFRRLPESGMRRYSVALAFEVRAAQERRAAAIDILEMIGEEAPAFDITARVQDDPEKVAARVRDALGITIAQQSRWNDPATAFKAWREAIESVGVLVTLLGGAHHGVPLDEVRGFAIAERSVPVIVVNGADRTNARIFTLMHELGHVVLGQSAIENEIEPGAEMPAPELAIEVFCNRLAASILMPRDALLAEGIVTAKPGVRRDWTDAEIAALAERYCVSREALLIRLAALGRAADDFVRVKRAAYAAHYREITAEEEPGSGFAPYRYQLVNYLGRGFTRLVFQGYYGRRLTLNTVSGYLGTQAKYVPTIESVTFGPNVLGAEA
jgi:Zn-dependent peptidase ImmA (M78 family)/DNA-binding XRE family transcriptional regulator